MHSLKTMKGRFQAHALRNSKPVAPSGPRTTIRRVRDADLGKSGYPDCVVFLPNAKRASIEFRNLRVNGHPPRVGTSADVEHAVPLEDAEPLRFSLATNAWFLWADPSWKYIDVIVIETFVD